jgi:UDP-N-acetylglucosamine acyltransferase
VASRIHPTAIIAPDAQLGEDVEVGPHVIVGPQVTVGPGCVLGPGAMLERNVRLGARVRVGPGSVLGGDPQDLKYRGEETWVEVGDDTIVREYCTVNRGTTQSLRTTIGRDCLLMTYVHVAHDCHIGDGVILSNSVGLAGHVTIDTKAILGGMTGVHQFVRIGAFAFIGGMAKVTKDIPPYLKADGNPARLFGLNVIGLQRNGFTREMLDELKKAYRLFFRSDLIIKQALARARSELAELPEVETFVRFIEASERGVAV